MTISSTARVAGPFTGAGSTATFPFAFKVFDETDLSVVQLTVASGAIAVLTLTADYTVALNADQDANPGGSITLTAGNLAVGLQLVVTTDIAALQGLDLTNGGAFYPDVINAALDLLTILVQQLAEQLKRTLQAPIVDAAGSLVLPAAAERAGRILMFDANGNPSLVTLAPGSAVPGAQAAAGAVDGNNHDFVFVAAGAPTPVPVVFAGGVFQTPGTDYTVPVTSAGPSSWNIHFTDAPTNGPVTVMLFA